MSLKNIQIIDVRFENGNVIFDLSDGRLIGCPMAWFTFFDKATPKQLANWKLIDNQQGVLWEELEDMLSLEGMFLYKPNN